MIAVFLAMGFEETEALAVVDILRRASLDVVTVGIGGRAIRGSHGITVAADLEDSQFQAENTVESLEAVVLPGGMPGTLNLEHSPVVQITLDYARKKGLWICAICAAPSILGHRGLLNGRKAICFPGYEEELTGASIIDSAVVVDDRFITSRGPGTTMEFGFQIVSELKSPALAKKLRASMQCR